MAGRESAATAAGLALIAKGAAVRDAAKAAGVAPSTLSRALARREAEPRAPGRRPKAAK